ITLKGAHARLEPLSQAHRAGLIEAVNDGELWRLWYTAIPAPEGMEQEIERRLSLQAKGSMLPFTVFDAEGRIAVEFRTHFFNRASRKGIERLGAKMDGILRSHQIGANGALRDTVVYSIIAGEWPAVKQHLTFSLNR